VTRASGNALGADVCFSAGQRRREDEDEEEGMERTEEEDDEERDRLGGG